MKMKKTVGRVVRWLKEARNALLVRILLPRKCVVCGKPAMKARVVAVEQGKRVVLDEPFCPSCLAEASRMPTVIGIAFWHWGLAFSNDWPDKEKELLPREEENAGDNGQGAFGGDSACEKEKTASA